MRLLHLIFGISVLVIFLLTGQYMDRYLNHMVGVPDGLRMLYRTRHIFILLAGLLNLAVAAYFSYRSEVWRRVMQALGSSLIVVATALFITAFFYEPKLMHLQTPLSHWGTYTIGAGTLFHVFSGLRQGVSADAR